MSLTNKEHSEENIKLTKKNIIETLGTPEKIRKLRPTINDLLCEWRKNPNTLSFTKDVLITVKNREWVNKLNDRDRDIWKSAVRDIIVYKLGLPYLAWAKARDIWIEKKKDEKKLAGEMTRDGGDIFDAEVADSTYEDIISEIDNYSFTSD